VGPFFSRLGVLLQRLVGIHQSEVALALGVLLLATLLRIAIPGPTKGRPGIRALTCTMLLYCLVLFAGYFYFGSQLKPHYIMPLFPVPAVAIGLLAAYWPGIHPVVGNLWRAAVVAVAIALAVVNVRQTWEARFLLDRYQITIAPQRSNLITLGEMRQVSAFVAKQSGGKPFNLLFTAPDDGPEAYTALLLAEGARVSGHPQPLRVLIVQPADWLPAHWPPWARALAACQDARETSFSAARVWIIPPRAVCARPKQAH
jgi:hypothetical protein